MSEGGWSSGAWGEAGWGCSVYDRTTSAGAYPTDSVAAAALFTPQISELGFISATDTASQSIFITAVSDEAVAVASTEVALVIFGCSVLEASSGSDTYTGGLLFECHEYATANASNTFAAQATFNSAVTEAASSTDAPFANAIFPATVTEFVDCSVEIDRTLGIYTLIFESSSISDIYAAQVTFGGLISEVASAQSTSSSLGAFNATVQDTAQGSDTVAVAANFISTVTDTARASDTFVRRLLWELIDDDQTVGWQLINTNE